ncbi:MAG: ferrous iron transport protein A [Candidatus Promineofilum sp.]|nr:ferrous iron transport protein A [Promineifilum sp.]MCW5862298.1 ferrous iron transport protein A [Anaerolineae bacterium]
MSIPLWPTLWLALTALLALGLVLLVVLLPAESRRRLLGRREAQPAVIDERAQAFLAAGLLPLSDCPRDRTACLRCLQVDRCVVHRLLELGLTPGVELRVVQDNGGPMLVSVRGSRVALGRDLADNLWVEMGDRANGK